MLAEKDNEENKHAYAASNTCGDGSTLYAHCWHAKLTEYKCVVANDVKDINHQCYHHRVDNLVGAAQRC